MVLGMHVFFMFRIDSISGLGKPYPEKLLVEAGFKDRNALAGFFVFPGSVQVKFGSVGATTEILFSRTVFHAVFTFVAAYRTYGYKLTW